MGMIFRNPSKFRNELENFPTTTSEGVVGEGGSSLPAVVTAWVIPARDTTQRNSDGLSRPGASVTEQSDQTVTITQNATADNLLEISYIGLSLGNRSDI
mmetsp:Transcript_26272/g.41440  ORF Transcript_26272/g.41440 Transcript_26272/m.41440 type:complete len:99 (-) Transcript_26272:129-425(-)